MKTEAEARGLRPPARGTPKSLKLEEQGGPSPGASRGSTVVHSDFGL